LTCPSAPANRGSDDNARHFHSQRWPASGYKSAYSDAALTPFYTTITHRHRITPALHQESHSSDHSQCILGHICTLTPTPGGLSDTEAARASFGSSSALAPPPSGTSRTKLTNGGLGTVSDFHKRPTLPPAYFPPPFGLPRSPPVALRWTLLTTVSRRQMPVDALGAGLGARTKVTNRGASSLGHSRLPSLRPSSCLRRLRMSRLRPCPPIAGTSSAYKLSGNKRLIRFLSCLKRR